MDKKPRSPIVAERDDMIGRTTSDKRADQANSKTSATSSIGLSGPMRSLVLLTFFGLIGAGLFGWSEYQQLSSKHENLQSRFELLESRLSSTDESVTQSGAAMQVNISKHSDELKKHWSEIRKLWGVTNDINKTKISDNKKDIAFLAKQRLAIEQSIKNLGKKVEKDSDTVSDVGLNYLTLTEELNTANQALRNYVDQLNQLKAATAKTNQAQSDNTDAIAAMDSFRRKTTQKIYDLEQRAAVPSPIVLPETPISEP
jgi:DNA repair exonuclease SbcCD ATPase subunit